MSCKDRVQMSRSVVVEKDIVGRMMYFGIGAGGWLATMCGFYAIYRYCKNQMLQTIAREPKPRATKKRVHHPVHCIGDEEEDEDDDESEYSDTELDSIKRKFTGALSAAVETSKSKIKEKLTKKGTRSKDRQDTKQKNMKREKYDNLDGESTSDEDCSSGSSYSEDSQTGSESGSESESESQSASD
mmetsp:Transcript_72125/g.114972  ORF Transcript_72125/g.114972 Transcript_72125/m.114972 type:complete len:186 (+) Transcript_72125:1-558(+)